MANSPFLPALTPILTLSGCAECGARGGTTHEPNCNVRLSIIAGMVTSGPGPVSPIASEGKEWVEVQSPAWMHMLAPGGSLKNSGDTPMVFLQKEGNYAKVEHDFGRGAEALKQRDDALENAQNVVQTLMLQNAILERVNTGLTDHINRLLYGEKPRELPAGVKPAINLGATHG